MITNLVATIVFNVVTNWTVTSVEYPKPLPANADGSIPAVYYATGYHETGLVYSNTLVEFNWGTNTTVRSLVESKKITVLQRVMWQ